FSKPREVNDSNLGFAPFQVSDQRTEDGEADCKRRCPVNRIQYPKRVVHRFPRSTEFLAQNPMLGKMFFNSCTHRFFCPAIGFGNFRAIGLETDRAFSKNRQDFRFCRMGEGKSELKDFVFHATVPPRHPVSGVLENSVQRIYEQCLEWYLRAFLPWAMWRARSMLREDPAYSHFRADSPRSP